MVAKSLRKQSFRFIEIISERNKICGELPLKYQKLISKGLSIQCDH